MNAVVFYSNTGESRKIALNFADKLGYPFLDIFENDRKNYKNLVIVFPVHCQNIPDIVKDFLRGISVENLTAVATYGKMCPGNVLYEIQKKYTKNIVAAAYIPTKHSYIDNDDAFCDFEKLDPIVDKIKNPSYILLPKLYKNPLANIFPKMRSRLGIKIQRSEDCNGCNICAENCPLKAVKAGAQNSRCIRCLKCVATCPSKALTVKLSPPLKLYLRKKKSTKVVIYV